MPVVTLPSAGDSALASAEAGQKFVLELVPGQDTSIGAGSVAASLSCDGLPEVFIWVRQIPNINGGGLIGCTFQPVFSVSIAAPPGAGVDEPEWLPLTQPQVIPFGVPGIPIYFRDRLPGVSAIGFQLVAPAGGVSPDDNCTFEAVLGVSQ